MPKPRPRVSPMIVFVGLLAVLLAVGLLPWIAPAPRPHGLPDGPEAREAAALLRGHLALPESDLRFASSIGGASPAPDAVPADAAERVHQAERLLAASRSGDPRLDAARAAMDLAGGRYESAARRYRRAIGRSSVYAEAHLGLGMVLALEALASADPVVARRLELQAIAQFAAVPRESELHTIALYDRAVMLERAGRETEARLRAGDYLALDSSSAWAGRMRLLATR